MASSPRPVCLCLHPFMEGGVEVVTAAAAAPVAPGRGAPRDSGVSFGTTRGGGNGVPRSGTTRRLSI